MKFVYCERGGDRFPGVLTADESAVLPLSAALGRPLADLTAFIRTHTEAELAGLRSLLAAGEGDRIPLTAVRMAAPIRRPLHDILCVGANYADHVKEIRKEINPDMAGRPKGTVYFSKRALVLLGPDEAVESHRALDECLDYEAELAVIIGKDGRDIPPEKVEEHIFGYSVFNDVSARTLQKAHMQWFRGKSLDGFSVMGPCIVHRSALPLPLELDIASSVNGEERQRSNTRQLIAGIIEVVHTLSQGMTLEAGDIIATGTPSGVGMGFDPPRYMRPGDSVCCEIEGIGRLCSPIV